MIEALLTPQFWIAFGEIMVVNILLSGDNAVVIALACRNLPERYRNRAIMAGAAGAIVLRIIFCVIIAWLMAIPFLRLVGGALLLWIGIKLLVPEEENHGAEDGPEGSSSIWGAIRTVIIADAVMSLDNVIAITAAAKNDLTLIILGLLASMPLVIWGSQIFLKWLNRWPILITAGGGLLGWLGAEVMVGDPAVHQFFEPYGHWGERIAGTIGVILVIAVGKMLARRQAEMPKHAVDLGPDAATATQKAGASPTDRKAE
ncbi:MAG: TerC family protein [Alphaproteobacteria bacterium]